MSDFDNQTAASMADAVAVMGQRRNLRLDGRGYDGIFDEHRSDAKLQDAGDIALMSSTWSGLRSQFRAPAGQTLEAWLDGQLVTIEGRQMRVAAAAVDAVNVTLTLSAVDAE